LFTYKGLEGVQRDTKDWSVIALTHGVKESGDSTAEWIFSETCCDCTNGVVKERVSLVRETKRGGDDKSSLREITRGRVEMTVVLCYYS
jgi:hypothetical protein